MVLKGDLTDVVTGVVFQDAAPQKQSPCDVEALEKCLKVNKGDHKKCRAELAAFQQACSKANKSHP